jgi:hypothetical protein
MRVQSVTTLALAVITIGALAIGTTVRADAFPLAISHAAFAAPTDGAKAPTGWLQFCKEHPQDCQSDGKRLISN